MTTQTTTTPAVSPLMEIALRIREMRRITGFTEKEMAEKTGVTEAEYRSYETGTVDLPFTFLHKCSLAFGLEDLPCPDQPLHRGACAGRDVSHGAQARCC